jgi:hypothetical protein
LKCLICNSDCIYYFSKEYLEPPYSKFMLEIGAVDYYKCKKCGFVLSKTHSELDHKIWINLNKSAHDYNENPKNKKMGNPPPYIEQAVMILILDKNKIIDTKNMLDYAAGHGTLSKILSKYCDIKLPVYDKYVRGGDFHRYIRKDQLDKYDTVINSAMFEHILKREDLDDVDKLVNNGGCLILHTVVCENIPQDSNWFFLQPPVHTAFHTNKSMDILMNQWGYKSSIYCPKSKSWILLKKETKNIKRIINSINKELQTDYLYYKKGFVDYWKGFK